MERKEYIPTICGAVQNLVVVTTAVSNSMLLLRIYVHFNDRKIMLIPLFYIMTKYYNNHNCLWSD